MDDQDFEALPGDENAKADVDNGDYELHRKLLPGDLVFDIGAHIGFFTEHASKQVGPRGLVIALEPDWRNYQVLVTRMAHATNVECLLAAAGNMNGVAELWHNEGNSGGHSLYRGDEHANCKMVHVLDAGQLVNKRREIPAFIKIDTEGSEGVIIESLLDKCDLAKTHIAVEVHTEQLASKLEALFQHHGWNFRPKDGRVGIWYADKL